MKASTMRRWLAIAAAVAAITLPTSPAPGQSGAPAGDEVVRIWPGQAPGSETWTGSEASRPHEVPAGPIIVFTEVRIPTLTIVRPPPGRANGTAMIVLPGGGFAALAWDLEGTEVARWLAQRGVTVFILKYRVGGPQPAPGQTPPAGTQERLRAMLPAYRIALMDARQAVRVVREGAAGYGIDPHRIGMIGFSAGAATTLGAVLEGDAADRPDFAAPIYGMMMPDAPPVPADAPPLFLVTAQDDPAVPATSNAEIFRLWTEARRPAELHIYSVGGHGFGMRPKDRPVDNWPLQLEAWLRSQGLLSRSQAADGGSGTGSRAAAAATEREGR